MKKPASFKAGFFLRYYLLGCDYDHFFVMLSLPIAI
jgi:hypothetical protein